MKLYYISLMSIILSSNFTIQTFWNKWIDTINNKIHNHTQIITHKEFPSAHHITLHNEQGSITINSWKQNSIAIEIITSCPEYMHQNIDIDITYIDQNINITTIYTNSKTKGNVSFNILVPETIHISAKNKNGDIVIKDIQGNIDLETHLGTIKMVNPRQDTYAKTNSGNIFIKTDMIEHDTTINLETDKGTIEFYTTPYINTHIKAQALQGKVTSELPITLTTKTTKLDASAWKEFRQIVDGSIGTAHAHLTMQAHNGSIAIYSYTKPNDIF